MSLNKLSIKNYLLNTNSDSIKTIGILSLQYFLDFALFSLLKYYLVSLLRLQVSSEVLPAVLDSPLGSSVLSGGFVGEWLHVDSLPLLGLLDSGEVLESPSGSLKGLGSRFIGPLIWGPAESSAGPPVDGGVVNETEGATLHTELPFSLEILDAVLIFVVVEFLVLVLLDPLIQVAWDHWPSSPPRSVWPPAVLAVEYEWSVLLGGFLGVDVHASAWLHSGGVWLSDLLGELWDSVAVDNLDVELNIGVEWDWLATEWGLGESATVSVVGWAVKTGLVSLVELSESEVPAREDFVGSEREGLWETAWLSSGVSDFSSVLEVSSPVDSGPVSWCALVTAALLRDADANSREIITGTGVSVIITVWSVDVWAACGGNAQ